MVKFIFFFLIAIIYSAEFKSERQYGIEQQLHAPCCWGGVISEHDSPMAEAIKSIIQTLIDDNFNLEIVNSKLLLAYENQNILDYSKSFLKKNMTDDEIVNFFVGIHGEKVRALPENKGLGWIAWKLPTFMLFLSIFIGIIIVRNFRGNKSQNNEITSKNEFINVDKAMKEMGF